MSGVNNNSIISRQGSERLAIGTLTSLKKLVGNLLQDEKLPGLHVAFGNPYPQFTSADWDAKIHVDVIPTRCTIEVDGRVIMRDGEFTI